jgi:hypothetical protein
MSEVPAFIICAGPIYFAAGVSLADVSKRLGHSGVFVTATVYSHGLTQDELAAADIRDTSVQQSIGAAQSAAQSTVQKHVKKPVLGQFEPSRFRRSRCPVTTRFASDRHASHTNR